ncbi:MAG TPA: hypothetical protein ENK85_07965 [Saprospiraceae bacterium]|nr:hypothetical protein [Saprospiraceae bacterium]
MIRFFTKIRSPGHNHHKKTNLVGMNGHPTSPREQNPTHINKKRELTNAKAPDTAFFKLTDWQIA